MMKKRSPTVPNNTEEAPYFLERQHPIRMGVKVKCNLGNYESLDLEIETEGITGAEDGMRIYIRSELDKLGKMFMAEYKLPMDGPKAAGQVALSFKE